MRRFPENSELLNVERDPAKPVDPSAADPWQSSPAFSRIGERGPEFVFGVGLILFWLTVWYGERLPIETLFAGPGMMLAGIVLRVRARSK